MKKQKPLKDQIDDLQTLTGSARIMWAHLDKIDIKAFRILQKRVLVIDKAAIKLRKSALGY